MKKIFNEAPLIKRWHYSIHVPFKTLITENQYRLPLIHTEKNRNGIHSKNKQMFQFHDGYMKLPVLREHMTHREQGYATVYFLFCICL